MKTSTKKLNERLEYVRKHITEEAVILATHLEVDESTIYRYKNHITLGEPISGRYNVAYRARKQAEKQALAQSYTPSLEERVDTLEMELAKEKAARVQTNDTLLELTLKIIDVDDKVNKLRENRKLFRR